MIDVDVQENIVDIDVEIDGDETLELEIDELGGGVAGDYENLNNKPRIENVELYKGTRLSDIGLREITNQEIDDIFK